MPETDPFPYTGVPFFLPPMNPLFTSNKQATGSALAYIENREERKKQYDTVRALVNDPWISVAARCSHVMPGPNGNIADLQDEGVHFLHLINSKGITPNDDPEKWADKINANPPYEKELHEWIKDVEAAIPFLSRDTKLMRDPEFETARAIVSDQAFILSLHGA